MSPFTRVFHVGHWSVATRIVVACVGIALVFAGAVTAIGYLKASAGLNEQGQARLESDAVIVTTAVDQFNSKHQEIGHAVARLPLVIRVLAAGDAVTPEDRAAISELASSLTAGIDGETGVSFDDAKGTLAFGNNPATIGAKVDQRDYFKEAMQGRDFISGVSRTTTDGTSAVFVATPIKTPDGKVVGVVNVRGDPAGFQRILDAEMKRLGSSARGVLMDEQGLVIASTVDPSWLLRPVVALSPAAAQTLVADKRWGAQPMPEPLGEQGLVPAIGVTHKTVFSWQTQGVTYHAVAMPLGKTHWTYVSAMPVSIFEAASQDLLRTSAVAVALGLVLALAATLLLTRPITGGLRRLTAAARGLARGDTQQELDQAGHDEIGQMAGAFRDVMAYQRAMAEVADAMADGNLDREVKPASDRDILGVAFGRMHTSLCELVAQVQQAASGLTETSAHLGGVAKQTGAAVQEVTRAVQSLAVGAQDTSHNAQKTNSAVGQLSQAIDSIARGASEQAHQVQGASATATRMAAGVEQVAANANSVAAASQQTKASAQHGAEAVRETVAGMAEINAVVTEAADKVQQLGKLGERIGQVVETIDDIAEQTNLLALNAAIEAARAGEHGKGFAVVADEVRKLAERSSRETKQIAELISQVQGATHDAVNAMKTGATKVDHGSAKADMAGKALGEIMTAVDSTVKQVTEIASSAQQMAAASRSVVEAMESISAVVEQNTASTEEMAAQAGQVTSAIQNIATVSETQSASTEAVSASTREMSEQVEQMSTQAQELATTASQLQSLVAHFSLGDATPAVSSPQPRRLTPTRRAA
jgi:methyl-accepting chemotaxis protein